MAKRRKEEQYRWHKLNHAMHAESTGFGELDAVAAGVYLWLHVLAGQAWGESRRSGGTITIGAETRCNRARVVRYLIETRNVPKKDAGSALRRLEKAGLVEWAKRDKALVLTMFMQEQVSDNPDAIRQRRRRSKCAPKNTQVTHDGQGVAAEVPRLVVVNGCDTSRYMSRTCHGESKSKKKDTYVSSKFEEGGPGDAGGASPADASAPPSSAGASTSRRDVSRERGAVTHHAKGRGQRRGADAPSTLSGFAFDGGGADASAGRGAWEQDVYAVPDERLVELTMQLTNAAGDWARNGYGKALETLGAMEYRDALMEFREAATAGKIRVPRDRWGAFFQGVLGKRTRRSAP